MRALMRLAPEAGTTALREIPVPDLPRPDWALVRVAYAAVCGSDIKMWESDAVGPYAKLKPPVVLGHEASGVVAQAGDAAAGFRPGDRVVYETTVDNCGVCRYCKSGDWNMCPSRRGLGSSIDGSFAPYVAVPARNLHRVPDQVPLETAALTEPLACAVHITEEAGRVRRGENVVIVGPGAIGLCCAITARAGGARPIVVGTRHSAHRLELARTLGFDTLCNDVPDLEEAVRALCGGELADVSIEAAGGQSSFDQAVHAVRRLGRVVIGAAPAHRPEPLALDMTRLYRYQLQLACAASTRPSSWVGALQILERYHPLLGALISERFPLERWEDAFGVTRRKEALKAVFTFGAEEEG